MEFKPSEPPIASLQMIGFDLLASNDIVSSSAFTAHESTRGPKILFDPRLGLPNCDDKCGTCHLANNKEHLCPGHFGHFSLALPIYNPQHIHVLARLLNLICPSCGKKKVKQQKRLQQTGAFYDSNNDVKEVSCNRCKEGLGKWYPELKFKVVTRKMQDLDIETIEMHAIQKREAYFPVDFWGFVDRIVDVIESPRLTRPLLAGEAMRILESVSDEVIRKLGLAVRPTCLIIQNFCIPPNCLRLMDRFQDGHSLRRLEFNQKTRSLSSILSMNKVLYKEYDDFYIAHKDSMELQARFGIYFKSFKIFSNEKQQLAGKWRIPKQKSFGPTIQKSRQQTWFKMNILGKRSHFSSLGVLCGAPNISLQQLAVPLIVAQKLKVKEAITRYNFKKWQNFVSEDPSKYLITRNNETWCKHHEQGLLSLQVGDVMERPLMDGDLIFSNRLPTLHKHSFLGFRAKIEKRHTFGINPILCGPISGDFDGDLLHVYAPQAIEARAEIIELLDVSQQMICSQGRQCLLKLSQDGILSSYLIIQRHFWLDKYEIQMLNMYCNSPVPRPAIVKAPGTKASLWTGMQVLSMTLPPNVEYDYSNTVLIQDSEVLQGTVENEWLTDCQKGIVASLCYSLGNQKALEFLTTLQNVLHEWMFQLGFSIGLKDMLLTDDFKIRKKLLVEVQIAFEDAKQAARRASDLETEIQSVVSGKIEILPDGFSSACHTCMSDRNCQKDSLSESAEKAATSKFQGVVSEIQTAVERFCSPFTSMMTMVKAKSKGSLSNLVQQCACLGLQLSNGERWLSSKNSKNEGFCDYPGLVSNCFVDGLNCSEFLSHLISARKPGKGFGAEGPGELFRKCMFGLRELYLAYDGSVRTRTNNHVIQLDYRLEDDIHNDKCKLLASQMMSVGFEAVGTLAVTALIEPAYNYTFDQSMMEKTNAIELLKETLLRGSGTGLKGVDFKSILSISSNPLKQKSNLARAALQIQECLHCFTLDMMPLRTMIKYDNQRKGSPWIIHMHLSQIALKRNNVKLFDIISKFTQSHVKEERDTLISSECDDCKKDEVCINFSFNLDDHVKEQEDSHGNKFSDHVTLIRNSVLPLLLKTPIKGSSKIKSARIQWNDFEQWSSLFDKENIEITEDNLLSGELFVEVSTSNMPHRGRAWEVVKESCIKVMNYIDWKRSRPYSIPEVFVSLGIEAARSLIYERLQECAYELGRKVGRHHLLLISDYMTHTGQVLAFSPSGLKEWNKAMNISAPFLEGAFQNPQRKYFDAARKQKTEKLSGILSSLVWGKADTTDENIFFDLIWSPQSQGLLSGFGGSSKAKELLNIEGKDVLEFLSSISQLDFSKKQDTQVDTSFLIPSHSDKTQCLEMTTKVFREYPPSFDFPSSNEKERDITQERSQLTASIQSILHHKYSDGEKVSKDDMKFLVENVIKHHPRRKEKIGCGIDAIKIGHSLEHPESRCFILCRKDGTFEDFSYRKCLLNFPNS